MAKPRPRIWDALSPTTRKRYLSKGRTLGQSEAQVRRHYETGGDMSAYRGHPRHGTASERQWAKMVHLAQQAKLGLDMDPPGDPRIVLDNLLSKGFTPRWIIRRLEQKVESRATYQSKFARSQRSQGIDAGWQPGRRRYYRRDIVADIELYYYH